MIGPQDLRRDVESICNDNSIPTCQNTVVHEFVEKKGLAFLVHMICLIILPCKYSAVIAAINSYLEKRQMRLPQVIPLRLINPNSE